MTSFKMVFCEREFVIRRYVKNLMISAAENFIILEVFSEIESSFGQIYRSARKPGPWNNIVDTVDGQDNSYDIFQ
jgi:hypothetical protein